MTSIIVMHMLGTSSMSFHKTTRWIKKRSRVLRRDEYLCQECKRYGKTTAATTVHHINPIEERPDLALFDKNLISLCSKCHDKMHDRINNILTALGMQWVQRVAKHIPPP